MHDTTASDFTRLDLPSRDGVAATKPWYDRLIEWEEHGKFPFKDWKQGDFL